MSSSPAVVDGVVYIGSDDGNVYAIGNPTTLTAAASPTTVSIHQSFTTSGTLKTTDGTPIGGATIQLQKLVSGTWTDVPLKTDTTTATGTYSISTSESAAGTYQYRTTYAGDATYGNATSNIVSVTISSTKMLTALTLTTSNPSPQAGQQFTLSGALTADSGTVTQSYASKTVGSAGLAGQSVYIQELQGSTWANIQGPLTTDQNGAFSFATRLTVPGPHSLRSHYGGTAQYAACDSPRALTITVGGGLPRRLRHQ